MKLKLHIKATISADAIKAVTEVIELLKSEAGVTVDDFSLNNCNEPVAEVVVVAEPHPKMAAAKPQPTPAYRRPWMDDPRCVLKSNSLQIDVDATLAKMGCSLTYLKGLRPKRGSLECAVKLANGQNHRETPARSRRNGNGTTHPVEGTNGRLAEFKLS